MAQKKDEALTAVIGEYADFYHETDLDHLPVPEGLVECRSFMPGVTRAWCAPGKLLKCS